MRRKDPTKHKYAAILAALDLAKADVRLAASGGLTVNRTMLIWESMRTARELLSEIEREMDLFGHRKQAALPKPEEAA